MIHHLISDNSFAFGGIQVILVGDFWKLKPIPSADDSKTMQKSKIFNKPFQHRIQLTKILRQLDCDVLFKNWFDMLQVGDCSEEGQKHAQSLNREITTKDGNEPTHIYLRKSMWNAVIEMSWQVFLANLCNLRALILAIRQQQIVSSDPEDASRIFVNFLPLAQSV